MLLFAMAVYRDIDMTMFTELPEAFRSLMGISDTADATGLAYGAIYSSYGALDRRPGRSSMGSAFIAGEERKGTLGLLLGNPRSRTPVLVSKAGAMVLADRPQAPPALGGRGHRPRTERRRGRDAHRARSCPHVRHLAVLRVHGHGRSAPGPATAAWPPASRPGSWCSRSSASGSSRSSRAGRTSPKRSPGTTTTPPTP